MVERQQLPSLSSIRAFEAAARLGSFATAARELGTSAASVSYHVKQLEKQVGLPLFQRHPHRVELTTSGMLIADEASKAFGALRASFVRATEFDVGRLSITTLPTFGTSWLVPKLGRFCAKNPSIRVVLDLSAAAHDFSTGLFDAAIRNGDGHWPGLRAIKLFPSLFVPLCAPDVLAAASDLVNSPGISRTPLLGRPDWWRMWYRALGRGEDAFSAENFSMTLSDEHLDAAAAIAGQGITIGSPILFAAEISTGRLVPAHDLVVDSGRAFWLSYPVARQRSVKIAAFQQWLIGEAQLARELAAQYISRAVKPFK